jgi:nucleotide-binding universal stress UspA family protein
LFLPTCSRYAAAFQFDCKGWNSRRHPTPDYKLPTENCQLSPSLELWRASPTPTAVFFIILKPEINQRIFMMTIIVPTDLSQVADNAARYAAQMIKGQYDVNFILYHVYENDADRGTATILLEKLKEELQGKTYIKVDIIMEEGRDLIDLLEKQARHTDAQLIVMGITGKSKLEQVFLGSNTLKIVERNVCPVLIIPPTAQYFEVKNVCLLSDFKDVQGSIPHMPIKTVLDLFRPALHIVNVNSEHYVSLTEEFLAERNRVTDMFQGYKPEFYFIGTYDLLDTVQTFVADKNIDMLITIPRNHSFFGSLFKTSNTKRLVFESMIPILAAHE